MSLVWYDEMLSNNFWTSVSMSSFFGNLTLLAVGYNTEINVSNSLNWEKQEVFGQWIDSSISYDGRVQIVADYSRVFLSDNYGQYWRRIDPYYLSNFKSIKLSSNGQIIYTIVGEEIYTYDQQNWLQPWSKMEENRNWVSISCSNNGSIVVAIVPYQPIYLFQNNFWRPIFYFGNWKKVVMSDSGDIQVIIEQYGYVYISYNYGYDWMPINYYNSNWIDVSISNSGRYIAVIEFSGQSNILLFDLNNPFNGFQNQYQNYPSKEWKSVSVSDEGYILAATLGEKVYFKGDPLRVSIPSPYINSIWAEATYLSLYFTQNDKNKYIITNYKYSINGVWLYFDPPQTGNFIIINGLTPNTEYTVRISPEVIGFENRVVYSNSVVAYTKNMLLGPNIQINNDIFADYIDIYYSQPYYEGIKSYSYTLDNGNNWIMFSDITNPFRVSNLMEGTYYIMLLVNSQDLNYAFSNMISVTKSNAISIASPVNINIYNIGYFNATIYFERSVNNIDYYLLYYQYKISENTNFDELNWLNIYNTNITINQLKSNTKYYLILREVSYNSNGDFIFSNISNTLYFTTNIEFQNPKIPTFISYTSLSYDVNIIFNQDVYDNYITGSFESYIFYEYSFDNINYIKINGSNLDDNLNQQIYINNNLDNNKTKNIKFVIDNLTPNTNYSIFLRSILNYNELSKISDIRIINFRTKKIKPNPILTNYITDNNIKIYFTQEDSEVINGYYYSYKISFLEGYFNVDYRKLDNQLSSPIIIPEHDIPYGYQDVDITIKSIDIYGNLSDGFLLKCKTPYKPYKPYITNITPYNKKIILNFYDSFFNPIQNRYQLRYEYKIVNLTTNELSEWIYNPLMIYIEQSKIQSNNMTIKYDEIRFNVKIEIDNLINSNNYYFLLRTSKGYSNGDTSISEETITSTVTIPYPNKPVIQNIIDKGNNIYQINFSGIYNTIPIIGYECFIDNKNININTNSINSFNIEIKDSGNKNIKIRAKNTLYNFGDFSDNYTINLAQIYPPEAPTLLKIIDETRESVTISFNNPYNGGSNIINYKYSLDNGNTYFDCDPPINKSPIFINNLITFKEYNIKIRASTLNLIGFESDAINVKILMVPKELILLDVNYED